MFWHMVQYAGYLVAAAIVGLVVGWLIWARRAQVAQESFEQRAKEMRAELMARRQETAAQTDELERLRRFEASQAAAEVAVEMPAESPVESLVQEPAESPVDSGDEPVADQAEVMAPQGLLGSAGDGDGDGDGDALATHSTEESSEQPSAEVAGDPDDLTRIEGIGPKMSAALVSAGVTTFAALAKSDEPQLTAAIEAAGMKFAPSLVTWAKQAQFLVDGDEEGFKEYTDRLVAGRDAGSD